MSEIWLENKSSFYNEMHEKFDYVRKVHTGKYSHKEHVNGFLEKRAFWEQDGDYNLRKTGADPDLSHYLLKSSIVGQALSNSEDIKINFGDLGDHTEPGSIAYKIYNNTDGSGTSYPVWRKKYANKQLVYQWMYVLKEGIIVDEDENGVQREVQSSRTVLIMPDMVLDEAEDGSWIKVKHSVNMRSGNWESEQKQEDQYTIYHLDGWTRYREVEGGGTEVIGEGTYDFYTDISMSKKRLPVYKVVLPFEIFVSYELARKVVKIFNLDSCVDTYVSEGTVTHLIEDSDVMTHEAFKDDVNAGEKIHNIEGDAKYIHPSAEPAQMGEGWIEKKRAQLEKTAFQIYGEAAKMQTATAIRYKSKSGIEAFLEFFVDTIESAENEGHFLEEQIHFPGQPSKWGKAHTKLPRKFQVLDPFEMVKHVIETIFANPGFPVTDEMVFQACKFVWVQHWGFELHGDQQEPLKRAIALMLEEREGTSRNRDLGLIDEQLGRELEPEEL